MTTTPPSASAESPASHPSAPPASPQSRQPQPAASVPAVEALLAAGEPIEPGTVVWLLAELRRTQERLAALELTAVPDDVPADGPRTPTRDELVAEFRLGPDPSPDMLAYLTEYVMEREAAAALDDEEDEEDAAEEDQDERDAQG